MNFDDSTMIFMVFWCPEGSLRGPKTKKKTPKTPDGEQKRKNSPKASKITRNNAPGCPQNAKSTKKLSEGSRQGPPRGGGTGKGGDLLGVGFYIHLLLKVVVLLSKTTLCENSGF